MGGMDGWYVFAPYGIIENPSNGFIMENRFALKATVTLNTFTGMCIRYLMLDFPNAFLRSKWSLNDMCELTALLSSDALNITNEKLVLNAIIEVSKGNIELFKHLFQLIRIRFIKFDELIMELEKNNLLHHVCAKRLVENFSGKRINDEDTYK